MEVKFFAFLNEKSEAGFACFAFNMPLGGLEQPIVKRLCVPTYLEGGVLCYLKITCVKVTALIEISNIFCCFFEKIWSIRNIGGRSIFIHCKP